VAVPAKNVYQFTVDVENSKALKNLSAVAKATDKATQRIEKDIKKQIKANSKNDQSIIKTRAALSKARAEYKKYTTTKKADALAADAAAHKMKQLNKELFNQTEKLRKGKQAIRGYTRELDKLANAERRAANRGGTQYNRPIGPIGRNTYASQAMPGGAGSRGFGGQQGRRAGFARGGRNMISAAGGAFAGAGGISALGAGAASLGSGFALKSSIQQATALQQQELKLRVLSKSYGEYDEILKEVSRNADMFNKSQKDATTEFANVYARLRPLGIELNDIKGVYKGFNAVAIASGATSESTRIAFMQLSQALGSGRLAGDEFRSISEQIPGVLIPVAREMGVTVGELKKLGAEGKITSDVLINALGKGFEENKDKIKELLRESPTAKFTALSNALSDTAVTIGDSLLPVVLPLVELATRLLDTIGRLPNPVKAVSGALFGLGLAFTAAAAGAKAFGLSLTGAAVAGFVALAAKIALAAAPLIGFAMVMEENIRKKQEFDEALASDEPEIMKDKIEELGEAQSSLKKQLSSTKKLPFYRGQAGDIADLKGRIKDLQDEIKELTKRRTLIIDIVTKVHKIGGIDYKMDGPKGRLVPVNPPETVSERREREAKEAAEKLKDKTKKGRGANTAEQIAKIESNNRRRLSELEATNQINRINKRYQIENRLQQESHRIREANLLGSARAALEIQNAEKEQNAAIDAQLRTLNNAITAAERRLAAAKQQFVEAAPGADRSRVQGTVNSAQARLNSAVGIRDDFAANAGTMRNNAFNISVAQSTEGFRQRAKDAQLEAQALRERNRLMMEGFSPAQVELQMQLTDIERERVAQISALTVGSAGYAIALQEINSKAGLAAESVRNLTTAQEENSNAITDYIANAQAYVGDIKARIVDIASTIEESISSAITGLVNGTMTATQAFHSFFKSVGEAFLNMAAQMIAKLIVIQLLKSAIGMFGGSFGGGANVGQQVDMPSSVGIGAGNGIIQNGGGQGFGTFGPNFGIRQFAKGGIVTGPTTALIGEGGMNEAVVPLPNGRSIPVDMGKGGGAGAVQTNITVNVDQGGQTDTETSGDNANKLGKAIDSAVKRVIMDERRVGGLLYNGRR